MMSTTCASVQCTVCLNPRVIGGVARDLAITDMQITVPAVKAREKGMVFTLMSQGNP